MDASMSAGDPSTRFISELYEAHCGYADPPGIAGLAACFGVVLTVTVPGVLTARSQARHPEGRIACPAETQRWHVPGRGTLELIAGLDAKYKLIAGWPMALALRPVPGTAVWTDERGVTHAIDALILDAHSVDLVCDLDVRLPAAELDV